MCILAAHILTVRPGKESTLSLQTCETSTASPGVFLSGKTKAELTVAERKHLRTSAAFRPQRLVCGKDPKAKHAEVLVTPRSSLFSARPIVPLMGECFVR